MNPNNKAKSQIILLDPAMILFCTNSLIYFDKNVTCFRVGKVAHFDPIFPLFTIKSWMVQVLNCSIAGPWQVATFDQ